MPRKKLLDYKRSSRRRRETRASQEAGSRIHVSQVAGPSAAGPVLVGPVPEVVISAAVDASPLGVARDMERSQPHEPPPPSAKRARGTLILPEEGGRRRDSQEPGPSSAFPVVVGPAAATVLPTVEHTLNDPVPDEFWEVVLEQTLLPERGGGSPPALTPLDQMVVLLPDAAGQGRRAPAYHKRTYRDGYVVVGQSEDMPQHFLGPMDNTCAFCGAFYFAAEAVRRDGVYSLCCKRGKVQPPPLSECPPLLRGLLTGTAPKERNYRQHVRMYNASLAFASFSAPAMRELEGRGAYCFKIQGEAKRLVPGSVVPPGDQGPVYNQLYFLDVDDANRIRLSNNEPCLPEVMEELERMLRERNPFSSIYHTMREVVDKETRAAEAAGRPLRQVTMAIKIADHPDRNRYNRPVATNEVAAIFVGDEPPYPVDVAVHHKDGRLITLNNLSSTSDPMVYPLLFPAGEPGFTSVGGRGDRVNTFAKFFCHRLQVRSQFSLLLNSGKLFQQYCVDAYCKVEASRLWWVKENQAVLRVDAYKGLLDHLQNLADRQDKRVGKVMVLPSSFYGSPRQMRQAYLDAVAIMRVFGKPDLFITFTCNPSWPEIKANLLPTQQPSDRPDLVARVFHLKLAELMDDLYRKQVFGVVQAYTYAIEYQKRGLPHAHILMILDQADKPTTAEAVDGIIRAEIPIPADEPVLNSLVVRHMLHQNCGEGNSCWRDGECRFRFPKKFAEKTDPDVLGFPNYRRSDNGVVALAGTKVYDNRHVVPYSPYLLRKYGAHANVEVCATVKSIKYLFKYIFKGNDAALVERQVKVDYDEVKDYLDVRYVSSPEACWRLFEYELMDRNITVVHLGVHLPDMQAVMIRDNEVGEALARAEGRNTHLMAFFLNNSQHRSRDHTLGEVCSLPVCPLELLYVDYPRHFCWHQKESLWKERQKGGEHTIGRVSAVSPKCEDLFFLRLLLHHVRGPTSFEDLRTHEGRLLDSFRSRAFQLNLLEDDTEHLRCLLEAASWKMPAELRTLFVHVLIHCSPNDPPRLYQCVREHLIRDNTGDDEVEHNTALLDIEDKLSVFGKSVADFGLPQPRVAQRVPPNMDQCYDAVAEAAEGLRGYDMLNEAQRRVADSVLTAVESWEAGDFESSKVFFVDGPGGSGKTFLYSVLLGMVRGRGKVALPCAWTGIAAVLLKGGSTSHMLFKLPVPVNESSVSNVKVNSERAELLLKSSLILWDEAPMAPKTALGTVDKLLRDLTGIPDVPFGGKAVLLGGDFRQLLPVMPGANRAVTVLASLKHWEHWPAVRKFHLTVNVRADPDQTQFQDWLLQIGEGRTPRVGALPEEYVEIPEDMLCPSDGDICTSVFGAATDTRAFVNRAVLCPKNVDADRINNDMVKRLPGSTISCFSVDTYEQEPGDVQMDLPVEFIHSLSPPGLPLHEIRLKPHVTVMLLRNLDPDKGLCNGTRLKVVRMARNVLDCRIVTGNHAGQRVFLPRITLSPSDSEFLHRFKRLQFPVRLAFAMTVNKSQGQTFDRIGLYLPKPVFSHGQLYVALSRVRRPSDVVVKVDHDPNLKKGRHHRGTYTKNVVYSEVLA